MTVMNPRAPVTEAQRRISPIERAVAETGYLRLSEAAEILDVAPITLRRLLKNPDISAPSSEISRGGYKTYLYTPEDLKELQGYFKDRTQIKKRNP